MGSKEFENYLDKISYWDYHFQLIEKDKKLINYKEMIISGLKSLQTIFGDAWLKNAIKKRHPLRDWFTNYALWSRLWLADFGKKVKELSSVSNFNVLKRKLMDTDEEKYSPAEAELETAIKLHRTDFQLKLEVKLPNGKKPDILAKKDGKQIFCEVTTLQEPEEERKACKTHDELIYPFRDPSSNIFVNCIIHKILEDDEIRKFQDRIKQAKDEVKGGSGFFEIDEKDVLEYYIFTKEKKHLVPKHVKGELKGPPFSFDAIKRIDNKIHKKTDQLPEDKPGILVIYDNRIFWGGIAFTSPQIIVDSLKSRIERYPFLIAVAIVSSFGVLDKINRVVDNEDYLLIQRYIYKGLNELTLFIRNPVSPYLYPEKELINAFK